MSSQGSNEREREFGVMKRANDTELDSCLDEGSWKVGKGMKFEGLVICSFDAPWSILHSLREMLIWKIGKLENWKCNNGKAKCT